MATRHATQNRRRDYRTLAVGLGTLLLFGHAAASQASRPQRFPNHVPYRQSGVKPVQGRSGNVTLATRALLGPDGRADVELTTGDFDGTLPPSGSLSRVQLKAFNAQGGVRFVRNEATAGTTVTLSESRLQHGETLQLQALARSTTARRREVITVQTPVILRPDLQAVELATPERATVHTPTVLSAVVREANLDTGARANVVLLADGVEIDRADGVWVDARGTVSVTFSHTFAIPGKRQLSVRIEDTQPGDYDPRNNTVMAELEVVAPGHQFSYHATVEDYEYHNSNQVGGSYRLHDGSSLNEWHSTMEDGGWVQRAELHFSAPQAAAFPLANVTLRHLTNGGELAALSFDNVAPTWENVENLGRVIRHTTGVELVDPSYSFYLTTVRETDRVTGVTTEMTSGQHFRSAGEVTYVSSGYNRMWSRDTGESESTWSFNATAQWGVRAIFGEDYRLEMLIADGTGELFTATPTVSLTYSETVGGQPRTETSYDDGMGVSTSFFESVSWRRGRSGTASYHSP